MGSGGGGTREMRVRFEIGSVVKRRGKMEMEKCVMTMVEKIEKEFLI